MTALAADNCVLPLPAFGVIASLAFARSLEKEKDRSDDGVASGVPLIWSSTVFGVLGIAIGVAAEVAGATDAESVGGGALFRAASRAAKYLEQKLINSILLVGQVYKKRTCQSSAREHPM